MEKIGEIFVISFGQLLAIFVTDVVDTDGKFANGVDDNGDAP
jgi:hypothetical protein